MSERSPDTNRIDSDSDRPGRVDGSVDEDVTSFSHSPAATDNDATEFNADAAQWSAVWDYDELKGLGFIGCRFEVYLFVQ